MASKISISLKKPGKRQIFRISYEQTISEYLRVIEHNIAELSLNRRATVVKIYTK